jgi:hypothetical protein
VKPPGSAPLPNLNIVVERGNITLDDAVNAIKPVPANQSALLRGPSLPGVLLPELAFQEVKLNVPDVISFTS